MHFNAIFRKHCVRDTVFNTNLGCNVEIIACFNNSLFLSRYKTLLKLEHFLYIDKVCLTK